jgi:hypothetical protein
MGPIQKLEGKDTPIARTVATVNSILADLPNVNPGAKPGADGLKALLAGRGIRVVGYADWQKIDAAEIRRGEAVGKPREKFTRVKEMLKVLGSLPR